MGKVTSKRMPKPKNNITKFKVFKRIPPTIKKMFICVGGPLHNVRLALITPKTMTFKLNGYTGFYSCDENTKFLNQIHWHEVN